MLEREQLVKQINLSTSTIEVNVGLLNPKTNTKTRASSPTKNIDQGPTLSAPASSSNILQDSHSKPFASTVSTPAEADTDAKLTVFQDLVDEFLRIKNEFRNNNYQRKLWTTRYEMFKSINLDLRPVNKIEKTGKYLRKHFPLSEVIDKIHEFLSLNNNPEPDNTKHDDDGSSKASHAVSHQGSEIILDIQNLIAKDPNLTIALKELKGKESTILTAFQDDNLSTKGKVAENPPPNTLDGDEDGDEAVEAEGTAEPNTVAAKATEEDDRDQNMIAWVILKVSQHSLLLSSYSSILNN
jgi:hypothetical protein